MENEIHVDLLCQFCHQRLQGEKGRSYQSGDRIRCQACGKQNDYDRVIESARQAVAEMIRERAGGDLDITFDKSSGK